MRNANGEKLTNFARALLAEWRGLRLPRGEARVVVAVSGGADSTALLFALDELIRRRLLSVELKVAHLDHGLRGKAGSEDARWVGELARSLGYAFESARERVAKRGNLEQAARRAR